MPLNGLYQPVHETGARPFYLSMSALGRKQAFTHSALLFLGLLTPYIAQVKGFGASDNRASQYLYRKGSVGFSN